MRISMLLGLGLIVFAISACKKTSTNSDQPANYRINGITDIVIGDVKSFDKWILYKVEGTGAVQETVTLSFEGLPADVIIDSTVHNTLTGIPDFTAAFRLIKIGNDYKAHDYDIKLICTGSITGRRSYNLKLKVLERKLSSVLGAGQTASSVLGSWGNCFESGYGTTYKDNLSMVAGSDSLVNLTNFSDWAPNPVVQVYFNPDGTISLPLNAYGGGSQSVYATNMSNKYYRYITGTGVYNSKYIAITVTLWVGGNNQWAPPPKQSFTGYIIMQR